MRELSTVVERDPGLLFIKVGLGTWAAVTGKLGQNSDILPLEEGSRS